MSNIRYKPHISVLEKDIEKGLREDSHACVIAEAVKHSVPNAKNVSVDLATIRFTMRDTGERYIYMTPYSAQQALAQFDSGIKPEPFDFHLKTLFQIRARPEIHNARSSPTIEFERNDVVKTETSHVHMSAPIKIGGSTPPKPILNHVRRFGLKVLPQPAKIWEKNAE